MATWQAENQAWIAEKYTISPEGFIVPSGDPGRVRGYDPWQFRELPSELARVELGDQDSALAFTAKYGLTGQRLDRTPHYRLIEEPVFWLEGHAAVMRLALELITLIHEENANGVDHCLATKWPQTEAIMSNLILDEQRRDLGKGMESKGLLAGGQVLAALIKHRVTHDVGPVPIPGDDGMPKRVYKASSLIQVVYCHLWSAWEGKTAPYQCQYRNCGRWWIGEGERRGPKARYCPPEGGAGESLCSRRERYYRSKEASHA